MLNVGKNLKLYFVLPALLTLLSLGALWVWGLKAGIDLAGGSLLAVSYTGERPAVEQVHQKVDGLGFGEVRVQPTGAQGYILRQRDLSQTEHQALVQALGAGVHEDEYTSIGPSIGAELMQKGWVAIVLVTLCIIAFIALAFRKVSEPVQSWKYGVVAIITLLFDVLVPMGVFAALGHYTGAEVDALFIVALLTIMGISINDKIVVFDRIRENLVRHEGRKYEFADLVSQSIRQTLARSINTSLTVVIMLLALYYFGPVSTQVFALTLATGMIVGTYSSIFLASPLLVVWEKWQKKS